MGPSLPGYDRTVSPRGDWPLPAAASTEGVLRRRLFAYLFDIVFIFLFSCLLGLGIFVLGLLTFTLGWWLFALLPASGVLYSALTVGGRHQGTLGMRMVGLRAAHAADGGRVDTITAAVHALLFYLAVTTVLIWAIDVLVGMARADRRLGHDLVTGVAIVRG